MKTKFKVGDRVKIAYPNHHATGQTGTITEISITGLKTIKYDAGFDSPDKQWAQDDSFELLGPSDEFERRVLYWLEILN
jgi:hypothetical protein